MIGADPFCYMLTAAKFSAVIWVLLNGRSFDDAQANGGEAYLLWPYYPLHSNARSCSQHLVYRYSTLPNGTSCEEKCCMMLRATAYRIDSMGCDVFPFFYARAHVMDVVCTRNVRHTLKSPALMK